MSEHTSLVTGADGFVGAWLARALLERGERVVAVDRPTAQKRGPSTLELLGISGEVIAVRGGVGDAELLGAAIADHDVCTVFHLAAEAIVASVHASPAGAFETNVRGTWTVLEAARRGGVEGVVVASSDKAYGAAAELPYREEMALRPTAPYEASKAAADLIARSYWPAYGLPVAVARCANTYGGGDTHFSRLVPEAACAALAGRAPVLRSDGSPLRDFLHVEDAARAYLAIADNIGSGLVRGEAFNAGGERPHSVGEIVATIARLASTSAVEPELLGDGVPEGEIDRQYVDASKLRAATGWRAEVELADGLRRTIEWYRAHPDVRPA